MQCMHAFSRQAHYFPRVSCPPFINFHALLDHARAISLLTVPKNSAENPFASPDASARTRTHTHIYYIYIYTCTCKCCTHVHVYCRKSTYETAGGPDEVDDDATWCVIVTSSFLLRRGIRAVHCTYFVDSWMEAGTGSDGSCPVERVPGRDRIGWRSARTHSITGRWLVGWLVGDKARKHACSSSYLLLSWLGMDGADLCREKSNVLIGGWSARRISKSTTPLIGLSTVHSVAR
jgi:hypothetical protein